MQRRREKDRLLKLAVRAKICSAMQFITCPSETRGYWLTERRNMSESWSWNVLSPPHTLVLWSSEFYSQLWLLMRIWVKRNRTVKKKKGTVKTADSLFWQSSLLHLHLLLGVSYQELVFPPFPAGRWRACPILGVPISKGTRGRFQAGLSSHLLKQPALGQDRVTWGQPPWQLRGSLLSSHVKWSHVIECTWLSQRARTSCLDSDTNKESCAHKSLLQL